MTPPPETKTKQRLASQIVDKIRNDPAYFVEKYVGDHLWGKQIEIMEAVRDDQEVTVKSGHGIGKTFTAARVALWFFMAFPNAVVLSTAPTYSQVKNQLWRELRAATGRCQFTVPKTAQTQLEAGDEWYALGLSTNRPDNFQGFHADYILAIVDEASGVDEEIFGAVDSVLTSTHARRLYIGNPRVRAGEFYRSHQDPDYERIHVPIFKSPNFKEYDIVEEDIQSKKWKEKVDGRMPFPELVTPRWAWNHQKKHPKGTPSYSVKILGEFPESAEDTFISQELVREAVERELDPSGPKELGVDPARFGDDQTGFVLREGPVVKKIWDRPYTDEMEVAGEVIATIKDDHDISAVKMDVTGVGAGAYDRVKEVVDENRVLDVDLYEVKGSESANDDEQYNNRATEVWGMLKGMLQEGKLDLPKDEDLINQLTTRKYSYTSRGQIKLESKEDLKSRGLPSPDKADGTGYAFYKPETQNRRQAHDMYG